MRCAIVMFLSVLWIPGQGFAKDYLVELFEEHYQEQQAVSLPANGIS